MSLFFILVILFGPAFGDLSANRERRQRRIEKSLRPDTEPVSADTSNSASISSIKEMDPQEGAMYVCPMHADFRRTAPAVCGVCGMALQVILPVAESPSVFENGVSSMPASIVHLTRRQAELLTLRFSEIRPIRIERWIRTSATRTGELTLEGQIGRLTQDDIQTGLRIRAFTMQSRNRVFSGVIQSIQKDEGITRFQIHLDAEFDGAGVYVVEIIQTFGTRLAIPAEALLFTPEGPAAFKLLSDDTNSMRLTPVRVRIGHRGELYDEVLGGLSEGDKVAQVGLFYLDAASKQGQP